MLCLYFTLNHMTLFMFSTSHNDMASMIVELTKYKGSRRSHCDKDHQITKHNIEATEN